MNQRRKASVGQRFYGIAFADRFWQHVTKAHGDGCWEWNAAIGTTGYGMTTRACKKIKAHRAAWELVHGPIPGALCVLHRCDNRKCVRPDHLFLGTLSDNVADMMAKGRNGDTRTFGDDNGNTKLSEADVATIRARWQAKVAANGERHGRGSGAPTMRELATEYSVTMKSIWCAIRRPRGREREGSTT
jgi:hypothetical protein